MRLPAAAFYPDREQWRAAGLLSAVAAAPTRGGRAGSVRLGIAAQDLFATGEPPPACKRHVAIAISCPVSRQNRRRCPSHAGLNFVFGEASHASRCAVFSIARCASACAADLLLPAVLRCAASRMLPRPWPLLQARPPTALRLDDAFYGLPQSTPEAFLARCCTEAVHELGHVSGGARVSWDARSAASCCLRLLPQSCRAVGHPPPSHPSVPARRYSGWATAAAAPA